MPKAALSGMKVLDLTWYLAGPYCTKMMADFGAEVIKVERPDGGDPARKQGPFYRDKPGPETSLTFHYLNTNKKSVTLNLKSVAGTEIIHRMVREVDVVVESFRPGVMTRLGLDYKSLEKINPALVVTSISNFGQTGPYRDYQASGIVIDALAGWAQLTGRLDREPLMTGGNLATWQAALTGCIWTMMAVRYADKTRVGQQVDVSILESAAIAQIGPMAQYVYTGTVQSRDFKQEVPNWITLCQDGYVVLMAHPRRKYDAFLDWANVTELREAKYTTKQGLHKYRDEIGKILESHLGEQSHYDVFYSGQKQRLPFGIICSPADLATDEGLTSRDFFVNIDHPCTGRLRQPGAPFKMSEASWRNGRAPLLGEHNEEVYCGWLGFSKRDLVRLRESHII